MARTNTSVEVIAEVTEVGVMTDQPTTAFSTTVAVAVAEGATALTVAAGTNSANSERFRIGDRPLIEAGEIESGGGTTTWVLMSALSAAYAVGEAVVEVVDTVIGDITEDGIQISYDGGDQAVRAGTEAGAYTYIPSGDQAITVQFSLLNMSMENFAAHAGIAETAITGAGTTADPYVLHIKESRYAATLERVWYFEGVRIDGQIIRVEANSGKVFAPQGQIGFSQGSPSNIPFIVRVLHGIKIAQWT